MNWCKPHWNNLREKIEAKGLTKFVSENASIAARSLTEKPSKENFDPLMESWARINFQMLNSPGLRGRVFDCPLCILVSDRQPEMVEKWLEGCTNEVLDYARELGLFNGGH